MNQERVKRKLSAILSADVVGYSRLMREDEVSTVRTLEAYRKVMSDLIGQFRGRVVDSPGDNLLSEFGSVVDAVQCAVEIHEVIRAKNEELPEDRRMLFRIGVNLGDVIEEGNRIYGDGVNIAARLEGLAEAGGICISGSAHEQIKNKLALGYEYIGEHTVKNIAEPLKVYRVPMGPKAATPAEKERTKLKNWQWTALGVVGTIIVIIGALAIWNFYFHEPFIEPASVERMAYPLPDKPSIAVLPFNNMSGDPEQDYIGDGLSENIISALSVSSELFVIARNSTFTYKGKPVKVQQVAEDLGVQYVLEGSIQKSGNQLRVTAQFIDALSGHHLWSEVYDREMKNLFELQDEITKKIMVSLQVKLSGSGEDFRLVSKSTDNLEAWKHFNKGGQLFNKRNPGDNAKAREHFEAALDLDPEYLAAMGMVAGTHLFDCVYGWSESPLTSMNLAIELAQKTVELDEQDPVAHAVLGVVFLHQRQHEKAITEGKRAITLNPNYAHGHFILAMIMRYSGRFEEAITLAKKVYRLAPNIVINGRLETLGASYIFLRNYEEALEVCKQMEESAEKALISSWIYQELGKEEEACSYMAKALKMRPDWSLESITVSSPYKDPAHLQRELDAYRKAGMPEKAPGAVQEKPSIAVLPFEDLSPEKDQEYFSDGLSEELINKLAQVKDLQVIARTSSFYFKGKDVDMRTIGEKLGVTYLLEGSVRKSGNQLRVTAQLIKAADGYHLWSETYDRELKDIFVIQDDIAKAVTTALSVTLGVGEFGRPGMTRNMEAYDEYLRAYANQLKSTPDSMLAAIDQFKQALDIDPDYGLSWVRLWETYNTIIQLLPPGQTVDFRARGSEALKRARAIAPDMPEVLIAATEEQQISGNWLEADNLFKQILDEQGHANPDANWRYGRMLMRVGRNSDALPYLQRAKRLNPLEGFPSFFLSVALFNSKRIDEVLLEARRGQTLEGSERGWIIIEFLVALENNDKSRAASVIADYYNLEGDYPDAGMLRLADLLLMENTEAALSELKELSKGSDISPTTRMYLAHVASGLGDPELAFESFRESEEPNVFIAISHPIHRGIRQLPAYKTYVRERGLYDYWRVSGKWGDFCRPVGDDDFVCE